ncbi:MAG: hypothetical protein KAR42_01660 [candidate division Zixibacteria bacterium]|nr:hypothetical protein [candidate division Zixibacteria bacterium]
MPHSSNKTLIFSDNEVSTKGVIIYKITETDYGFHILFTGKTPIQEWEEWYSESREILAKHKGDFSVLIDMRNIVPPDNKSREVCSKGQRLYKNYGMARSVVIFNSPVITQQFKQIAHETGIYKYERYIDSSHVSNWETIAMDWLIKSIDPDKKPFERSEYL